MKSKDRPQPGEKPEEERDQELRQLRRAEENLRKAQGDDATGPTDQSVDPNRTGNKPRFDRDR